MAEDVAAFVVVGAVGVITVTVATAAVYRTDEVSMSRRVDGVRLPGA